MPTPLYHVDAFTDRPFAGNPAAVCLLAAYPDDAWLQGVAGEMNLSETAFLVPQGNEWQLRWFTPKVEVALCGHATLASAHVLWTAGRVPTTQSIRFHTKSGVLVARRQGDQIELDFPLNPEERVEPPAGLLEALGLSTVEYVGRSRFDHLVVLDKDQAVRALKPDFGRLATVATRGVIVTARSSDSRYDFISRFFAPAAGIDEDPVTGSAHCCLASYWQKQLKKDQFVAYQASPRGGILRVRVQGDRCFLGGQAVTVARGELQLA